MLRPCLPALSAALFLGLALVPAQAQSPKPRSPHSAMVQRYCFGCHNNAVKTAGISLQGIDLTDAARQGDLLEKVLRKVKNGQMPPAGAPRPDAAVTAAFSKALETTLDAEAAAHPNPGHTGVHRLNRAEYSNAIRDIFDLDINAGSMLPVDDSGYGFDNIGSVLSVSPLLLDRYLSVARKVSRLIVGDPTIKPIAEAFEARREPRRNDPPVPTRLERISDDLPFNSAGGVSVRYYFPLDAEYVLRVNFGSANGPAGDTPIEVRLLVKAGLRTVGVTFPRESLRPELPPADGRRPAKRQVAVDLRMDGASVKRTETTGTVGSLPRIANLSIAGPFNATGPGDTASRRKVFLCRPARDTEAAACAEKILTSLARRAYRRPVTQTDVRPLVNFYQQARQKGNFEYGIQKAIEALLISPDFLFRVESNNPGIDLASRLSFFLWSSVPDDELLDLGATGKLTSPAVLRKQVQRMLDDPRSASMVSNFAGQWLHIRNLAAVAPDPVAFPDFDESLRFSMQRETELFFESILRENRSALDLLRADYTFLNERLAKHYGIPNIYGSQFRRVTLQDATRGGLLGQASLLTVTSQPNRTSVVQRGKWVLDNLLGAPPAPPPPDIPSLEATTKDSHNLSLRAALELHRGDPGCAGCHAVMDPIGFALENYNGIGQWRTEDGGSAIDASGKLPDGTEFTGPAGLRKALTTVRSEEFVSTVAERLLTYALGRGLEYYDQPAVRAIVRQAEPGNYRLRDLITAVVLSNPYQRKSANP